MTESIKLITDDTFETDVIKASGPVLVDFWAEWCAPCNALASILSNVAEEYLDAARICKINADENKATAERYNVRGLPTLILFVDGVERARILGATSKTRVAELLDSQIEG